MAFVKIEKVKRVREGSLKVPGELKNVSSPKVAAKILDMYLDGADREMMVVICLNVKNDVINISTISIGSLNCSIVHPREVFKIAILSNAGGIILGHNHPSGNSSPSNEDINITKRLDEGGKILGIDIMDHIIIGENNYTSFKEKGLL